MKNNYIEHRPWGSFENLLDEEYCKVKRLIIKPGQRLSSQYHHKRSECWVVVQGTATITLEEKDSYRTEYISGNPGQVIKIPVGTVHRLKNDTKEDLIIIETQTGTYFGEDDIVRLKDDYGRISED